MKIEGKNEKGWMERKRDDEEGNDRERRKENNKGEWGEGKKKEKDPEKEKNYFGSECTWFVRV